MFIKLSSHSCTFKDFKYMLIMSGLAARLYDWQLSGFQVALEYFITGYNMKYEYTYFGFDCSDECAHYILSGCKHKYLVFEYFTLF